ncbi:MAG: acyltransferase family protein [Oscillospiraceae bacterium]|jgi:peptidoglycan/LPS O-acetylase OafA/YrhL|nr:acyltransferase family protein [Oscillospiraceae bacterium]
MLFFITALRAFATIFITNSHYTGVYPNDIIANGGLLGDVLFFAVSGYCLTNLKFSFPKWFLKRFLRIYPAVFVITLVFIFFGFFDFYHAHISTALTYFRINFIYPTNYYFVIDILLLYIPYYLVVKIKSLYNNLHFIIFGVFAAQIIFYILFINKDIYNVDNVASPYMLFMFFLCMLIGAYIKKEKNTFLNTHKLRYGVLTVVLAAGYFGTKTMFAKNFFLQFQIANQIVLACLLFCLFCFFSSYNDKLEKFPKHLKSVISFLGKLTLEIYLVQVPFIQLFRGLVFPLNWLVITACILASAWLLHFVVDKLTAPIDKKLFAQKAKT